MKRTALLVDGPCDGMEVAVDGPRVVVLERVETLVTAGTFDIDAVLPLQPQHVYRRERIGFLETDATVFDLMEAGLSDLHDVEQSKLRDMLTDRTARRLDVYVWLPDDEVGRRRRRHIEHCIADLNEEAGHLAGILAHPFARDDRSLVALFTEGVRVRVRELARRLSPDQPAAEDAGKRRREKGSSVS